MTKKEINNLTYEIIGCAIYVHKQLGPVLLENIYEICFCDELTHHGFSFKKQLKVPVTFRERTFEAQLRLDVLVEDAIVVELKAVDHFIPVYDAQVLTYMHMLGKPKGLLINFQSDNLARNLKQFVNEHFSKLPDE